MAPPLKNLLHSALDPTQPPRSPNKATPPALDPMQQIFNLLQAQNPNTPASQFVVDQNAGTAGVMPPPAAGGNMPPVPHFAPLPGSTDLRDDPTAIVTPPIQPEFGGIDETLTQPADPLAPGPTAPTQPAAAAPTVADQWEQRWQEQYDVSPRDIIDPDLYDQLSKTASQKMDWVDAIGLAGIAMTNPEIAMRLIQNKEGETQHARELLMQLHTQVGSYKKAGMAEIARTRREEGKLEAAQAKQDSVNKTKETLERGKQAHDFLNDVQASGMPADLISAPTAEDVADPEKFYKWHAEATGAAAQYVGKQKMDEWLTGGGKNAPAWLAAKAGIDPTTGVRAVYQESGLYTPEEIAQREPLFAQMGDAADLMRQGEESKIKLAAARSKLIGSQITKNAAVVGLLGARVERLGEVSFNEQMNLQVRIEQQMRKIQADQYGMAQRTAFLTQVEGVDSDDMPQLMAETENGIMALQGQYDSLNEQLNKVQDKLSEKTFRMSDWVSKATASTADKMVKAGAAGSIDELYPQIYSPVDPSDPTAANNRRVYWSAVIMDIYQQSGIHPVDVETMLDAPGPGGQLSPLDSMAQAYAQIQDASVPAGVGADVSRQVKADKSAP